MPISRDEFDKGRKAETPEAIVEDYLTKNKGKAFSFSEIIAGLYNPRMTSFWDIVNGVMASMNVKDALEALVKSGRVKTKTVKGNSGSDIYYTIS